MTALERLRERVNGKGTPDDFWESMNWSVSLARALCDPGTVEKLIPVVQEAPFEQPAGQSSAFTGRLIFSKTEAERIAKSVLDALAEMAVGDE